MLKSLSISNYALITELNIDFESGFSVITGETGAGKSIILGALSLILGQRADSKTIKTDSDKCVIEAEFDISAYTHLNLFFEENELDNEGNLCLIRRELTSSGKSRAFINDTPVSLNVIRDLSNQLIDIHSQHENLLLSNANYQLDVVDTMAQNSAILNDYKQKHQQWLNLKSELRQLQITVDKQAADLDYIRFQYQQLSDAKLQENEQEELEMEQETLAHAEEIKTELQKTTQLMDDENKSLSLLRESLTALSHVKGFIPEGESWFERLQSTYIELKDINSEIQSFCERLEFNPERLTAVETRLAEIFSLLKKFRVNTVAELLEKQEEFRVQLERIESFDDEVEKLQKIIELVFEELKISSVQLTESRKKARKPIETYMVEQLTQLGIPNIQFQIQIDELTDFTENGKNEIQFLFSANKNRSLQPVSQIASGGEVSRLMLTIKTLIAHKSNLPTIIFDEIDTGVSGEIAHRMAEIMTGLGKDMQVITITHLPQIAAKGTQHYRVYKDDSGLMTETHIERLKQTERITELAQMLSGKNITEAALKNAQELLANG